MSEPYDYRPAVAAVVALAGRLAIDRGEQVCYDDGAVERSHDGRGVGDTGKTPSRAGPLPPSARVFHLLTGDRQNASDARLQNQADSQ